MLLTRSASSMRTVVLHTVESLTADLAELMLAIHVWSGGTNEYHQGT